MRIKKIALKNYRQYKDVEILFDKKRLDSDLHVMIGENGTGKTNLLNAINWCLYGDEPHLSRFSEQLPLLNLKNVESSGNKEVKVEIWLETSEKRYIIFTRTEIYRVYDQNKDLSLQSKEFETKIIDEKGNTKILSGEEAEQYVNRFVPKNIREFFFFDGERLDNYFQTATGQNIRHAIFDISQIDLLGIIEKKLDRIIKEFSKDAGKINPLIENTRKMLEQKENDLDKKIKQRNGCKDQAEQAKRNIKRYEEELRGIPDIETLETEREELKKNRKEKEDRHKEKVKEKQDLLFESGTTIMLYPAIKKAISIIEEKRRKKEIPPTIDSGLLENTVREGSCPICGRPLDNNSKNHVDKLLKDVKISSDVARELLAMENPLFRHKEIYEKFKENNEKLTREINIIEQDLSDIEQRITEIDKELSGYDENKIKDWQEQRKNFEEIYDQKQQELGILTKEIEHLNSEIESLNKTLTDEINKEQRANILKKQMDFATKALTVVISSKRQIMDETRKKIEEETKKLFLELIWKKKTFQDVKIDEDYNVHLIHKTGFESLGSLSAAERELLTLSFTLALHELSGFDAPLLIDTPVARVSKSREEWGKVISRVSGNKQIILLFTRAEYSEDISKILDVKACNKYSLKLSSDEKETTIEVL